MNAFDFGDIVVLHLQTFDTGEKNGSMCLHARVNLSTTMYDVRGERNKRAHSFYICCHGTRIISSCEDVCIRG